MKDKGLLGGWQCLRTLVTGNMDKVLGDWRRWMFWDSGIGSLGTRAEAFELFERKGLVYCKFGEEVLKDEKGLRIWDSEIGSLGRNAEGLEVFENTGIGNCKLRKMC